MRSDDEWVPGYDYETDVEGRNYRRLYREESAIAFSAIDCVLHGAKGIYASSELTTGRRAYALLQEKGIRTLRGLNQVQRQHLLVSNVASAVGFARRLRDRLGSRALVISPAPYVAPGWTQAEYLTFWETLIRTRIDAAYFNEGWEYSNGCTSEFAVASEQGIPTYDEALGTLSRDKAVDLIDHAVVDLEARGFDATRLRLSQKRLQDL